ncbi:MAG TPA: endopeptidase La, partial [Bacteroidales bacterium]|nr:endopeptidase La [Bacteroidales bacterium]
MKIIDDSAYILSELMQGDAEFIPIFNGNAESNLQNDPMPEELPILPLRNMVLFPSVVLPITVGRSKSIRLVKENYKQNKLIGVVAQRNVEIEDPDFDDLYSTGTLAQIMKILQMPDGSTNVIIQGKQRFVITETLVMEPYHTAKVKAFEEEPIDVNDPTNQALFDSIKDLALQIIQKSNNIPTEAAFTLQNIENPSFLINFIASNLPIDLNQKQRLLESNNLLKRAQEVISFLSHEVQMIRSEER